MNTPAQKPSGLPSRRTAIFAALMLLAALALAVFSLTYRFGVDKENGTALVGGPFTAVDHHGQTVTQKNYSGKYLLLFFGYTYCPDVCPTELQVMTEALAKLGPIADEITPVFVTIDPERDTPAVMASYVENFDPRMVGLTGSPEQIAAIAKAYRVFYAKIENAERPSDYKMDHSSIIYLMGPDGSFMKHFTYTTDPAVLADGIRQAIEK